MTYLLSSCSSHFFIGCFWFNEQRLKNGVQSSTFIFCYFCRPFYLFQAISLQHHEKKRGAAGRQTEKRYNDRESPTLPIQLSKQTLERQTSYRRKNYEKFTIIGGKLCVQTCIAITVHDPVFYLFCDGSIACVEVLKSKSNGNCADLSEFLTKK